tara:strand:+ start:148 stop:669 length:522 start_codon:yes stop_codon:yes gene_type:complete
MKFKIPLTNQGYINWLRDTYTATIDSMDLEDHQTTFMKDRFLEEFLYATKKADISKSKYFFICVIQIIGSVLIPVIASVDATSIRDWSVVIIGALVALCVNFEKLFHYSTQWQLCRMTDSALRDEWFDFVGLLNGYKDKTHKESFFEFAEKIQIIVNEDIKSYFKLGIGKKKT